MSCVSFLSVFICFSEVFVPFSPASCLLASMVACMTQGPQRPAHDNHIIPTGSGEEGTLPGR